MSRNVVFFFVSPFFRLAGAKVTFIFYSPRKKYFIFLFKKIYPFSNFSGWLRYKSFTLHTNYYPIIFFFAFYERLSQCGCKSSAFIQFNNPFFNLFWKYFLIHWNREGWSEKFYWLGLKKIKKISKYYKCISPDSSENPLWRVFGRKDCNGLLRQFGFLPRVRDWAPDKIKGESSNFCILIETDCFYWRHLGNNIRRK